MFLTPQMGKLYIIKKIYTSIKSTIVFLKDVSNQRGPLTEHLYFESVKSKTVWTADVETGAGESPRAIEP